MFLLSHEESGNHHCSNCMASEVKDKSVTFLLKASATGQVVFFFSKCSHQVAVKSFFPFHLCAFCWASKLVLPSDGWSQENCSVQTMAKLTVARKERGLKSCLSEERADPSALSSYTVWMASLVGIRVSSVLTGAVQTSQALLCWAASALALQPRNISAALKGRRGQRWIISDLWSNSIFNEKEQQREQAALQSRPDFPLPSILSPAFGCAGKQRVLSFPGAVALLPATPGAVPHPCPCPAHDQGLFAEAWTV